jgi:hypothetical protein
VISVVLVVVAGVELVVVVATDEVELDDEVTELVVVDDVEMLIVG